MHILHLQFKYQLSLFYLNLCLLSHLCLIPSTSVFLCLPSEIQDHIYCGHSTKAEAKVCSNSIISDITDPTLIYIHLGMTLTVYSNSHSIDTMTHSTLTSFHTNRQPRKQLSEPLMSARHSLVPEHLSSRVLESIIDCDEAIHLMLPQHQ